MPLTRNSSRPIQRQVDLTTAVCQERLLSTHVRHVIALVDLVAGKLPFDSALDIYVRMLRLSPEQARNIGSRALATLGTRTGFHRGEAEAEALDEVRDEERDDQAGVGRFDAMFSRVRRRIKGRVHEDLRHRINLAGARAEDGMLETHVENSKLFARALGDELSLPDAVELYLDTMSIPEGVSDVIFNRVLREIADRELPPLGAPEPEAPLPPNLGTPERLEKTTTAG